MKLGVSFQHIETKFVVDGNEKKNHIWNDISSAINAIPELKTSVSASNVYLVVKENRRVDDFVFHHISSIEGAINIAVAKEKDDFSKDMLDVTCDTEVEKSKKELESRAKENWRELVTVVESGKRKHSSYLQPNTEITIADMLSA
ncbi:hypothetical protein J6590_005442 [Homalodisca vitripennis]|nr:hypothetical protein J6590_005442 [Homalodisca vitripennis]